MALRAEDRGNPRATRPWEVRRILRLAKATKKDVFYDLGCGHGRVCSIAASKVMKAVGVEDHIATYKEAIKQVRKLGLQEKVKIRGDLLMRKAKALVRSSVRRIIIYIYLSCYNYHSP